MPASRSTTSCAWPADEQSTRSSAAASGASATATDIASSAPCTSPDGEETATSASSSRGARAAIRSAASSIQGCIEAFYRTRLRAMSAPGTGDRAPDFELPGTDGPFRLSEHRGRRVVLLFYPGDGTPVCTKQFCSYRDRAEDMSALDAVVVGISAQDVDSHEQFAAEHDLNVPLLADKGKRVAKLYGLTAPLLGTRRAVVIVDEEGVIRHRHAHALGLDYQSVDELRDALAALDGSAA